MRKIQVSVFLVFFYLKFILLSQSFTIAYCDMPISSPQILTIGTVSILLIGLIDYLITIDLSLSICYLIPIFIVTRYVKRTPGFLLSFLSAVVWYIAEYTAKINLNRFLLLCYIEFNHTTYRRRKTCFFQKKLLLRH